MDHDLILKNISRYIVLKKEEEDFFLSLLQKKKIKRKEFLLRRGEICKSETFITNGCLRVYTLDANGAEHVLLFGVEDWWVGDLYSFITNSASTLYIDALEDTDVLQITKLDLDRLYEQVPKFERFFRILFQNAYIAQQQRINQNLSYTAQERYLNFLGRYPSLEQRISQKQLAAYLGFTPVFLSILRKKLNEKK